MNDLISIIIPIYNVEKCIAKCIDSIINQTYTNIEIILVDDGSYDNCGKICDEYARKDKRIKVIHKKNGGVSDARNQGIDIAKGKYITFLDSDDYVSNNYVEYMYKLLKENNADISICGVQIENYENKKYSQKREEIKIYNTEKALKNMLYSEGIEVAVYAKLYKARFFENIRFPVGERYEDIAIIAKLLNKAEKIVYGNQKHYFYVTRLGSISKSGFNESELDYLKNVKEMLNYINQKYPNLEDAILRYYIYSRFRILRIILFSENKNIEIQEDMIKKIKKFDKKVFNDFRVPYRDKIAIITLRCGLPIFKISWYIYSKLTGRVL